eukprot:TRINITY_DN7428_c0_g2_i1.p1 TRINITY_DN7428_c0_g2~~TRINITY_DN7428_c0_g2_i1.p1  ORF type:complete len:225 (-),score=75.51 TRINITY_DN7428_c0_g2_i1:118-792(-)
MVRNKAPPAPRRVVPKRGAAKAAAAAAGAAAAAADAAPAAAAAAGDGAIVGVPAAAAAAPKAKGAAKAATGKAKAAAKAVAAKAAAAAKGAAKADAAGRGRGRGSGAAGPGVRPDAARRRAYAVGQRPVDKDIRRLQADHRYLSFPLSAFARLVREIQLHFTENTMRWEPAALQCMQMAAEEYIMYLLADAYLATIHRRCVTLSPQDLRLVRRLRQPHCWGETL